VFLGAYNPFLQSYEDRVESAKSTARPAFQAMMQAAHSKSPQFSVVYLYDTSRFSSSQVDAKVYKQELKKLGIELRLRCFHRRTTIPAP
jgi:DNA invertase Pin-like site-specific DNA recombinase